MIEKLERLAAAGIQLVPAEMERYFLFERDGFVALVERVDGGFGQTGASGMLGDGGLTMLMWRAEKAYFVAKGFEREATPDQIAGLRSFSSDLKSALGG